MHNDHNYNIVAIVAVYLSRLSHLSHTYELSVAIIHSNTPKRRMLTTFVLSFARKRGRVSARPYLHSIAMQYPSHVLAWQLYMVGRESLHR